METGVKRLGNEEKSPKTFDTLVLQEPCETVLNKMIPTGRGSGKMTLFLIKSD